MYEITPLSREVDCLYISHESLQQVYAHTQSGEKIGRLIAEYLFTRKTHREVALLTQNPAERYRLLLKGEPELLQQVPLKYLASYLGITPETLSRIRASIS